MDLTRHLTGPISVVRNRMSSFSVPCLSWTLIALMSPLTACQPHTGWDPADLTEVARSLEQAPLLTGVRTTGDIPSLGGPPPPSPFVAPQTVRVWRRSEGSDTSCTGTVTVMDLDEYVRHVVPHEWYASWHEESLRSGAVAARSYAAWWVEAGGKYDCADVCDTSYTQSYGESTDSRTDAAVEATADTFIVLDGEVVFAEYSAENGDPTEYGVEEPHCTGEERHGHGRGLCQWGSQRWASIDGKDHAWMVDHYYLGATLLPPLLAERLDDEYTIHLTAGESVTLDLSWENQGGAVWPDGDLHLDTTDPDDRPSSFVTDDWPSETRAASLDESIEPGQTASLELTLLAPDVDETTIWIESFGLYSTERSAWIPGDGVLDLEIVVYPAGTEAPDDTGTESGTRPSSPLPPRKSEQSESGCSCGGGAGGASWSLALMLTALLRRRQWRKADPRCANVDPAW